MRSHSVVRRIGDSEIRLATRIGDSIEAYPLFWIVASLLVSGAVEVAQAWPEIVPFAHAAGEIARNLGYAITVGVLFHWLLVSLPSRQMKLALYRAKHELLVEAISWGPRMLELVSQLSGVPVADLPRNVDEMGGILAAVPAGAEPTQQLGRSRIDAYAGQPANLKQILNASGVGQLERGLTPFLDRLDASVATTLVDFLQESGSGYRLAYTSERHTDLGFTAEYVMRVISTSEKLRAQLEEVAPEIDWKPPKQAED